MQNKLLLTICILFHAFIFGCGDSSSLNEVFVSSEDKKRVGNLFVEAEALYDQSKYEASLSKSEQILEITPNHERATQLKAFAELGIAGFSIFDLVTNIIQQAEDDASGSSTAQFEFFESLSEVLNITEEDFQLLGVKSDIENNDILKGLPVYIPNLPGVYTDTEAPRYKMQSLQYISRALKTICPFIDRELRETDGVIAMDRYECEPYEGDQKFAAQSYFIFFLGHIAESLIFNLVLLYSPDDEANASLLLAAESGGLQDSSNLLSRITALEKASKTTKTSLADLSDMTVALTEVTSNVQTIFNTEQGSMLYELMAGLTKAGDSFEYIPGVPDTFTKALTSTLEKITGLASSATSSVNSITNLSGGLKQQMGDKVINGLNKQVSSYFKQVEDIKDESGEDLSECEKKQVGAMCSAIGTIYEGIDGLTVPSNCDDYPSTSEAEECS